MDRRALAVLDHPYRGVLERGYADPLYLVRVLAAQLGRVDLVLRGEAVLLAAAGAAGGWDGGLPHVVAQGIPVLAEGSDLARLGVPPGSLAAGVLTTPPTPPPRWSAYDHVWFL